MGIDNLETLSDEEFINATEADTLISEPVVDSDNMEDEPVDTSNENDVDPEEDTLDDNQSDENEDEADEDSDTDIDDDDSDDDDNGKEGEDDAAEDTDDPDGDSETDGADDPIDFEAVHKEMFEPFTANGKEVSIDNVADARQLMQKGLGFQKHMAGLKPHLKIIKSLKDNDLLDVEKINNLIDLSKNNPEAIAKLVKDAGINPLDIDTADGDKYKPNNYEVSDSEFDLTQAIDAIKGNESYDRSIDIMGKQWDNNSRKIISENPEVVAIIDQHIQDGVFDKVQGFVDKEIALGRMTGMSNIEAYREGVSVLTKNGTLSQGDNSQESDSKKAEKNPLKTEAKKKQEAIRKKKRKAAAPSKSKPKVKKSEDNYDSMSDEEFLAAVS